MPTVFEENGWRFFFYSTEFDEGIHINCQKDDKEAKFWLNTVYFEADEEYTYEMSPPDIREVKKLIYQNFELIEEKWQEVRGVKNE